MVLASSHFRFGTATVIFLLANAVFAVLVDYVV
jgi:hypothetical protein